MPGWDIHDKTYYKELTISNSANGFRDISAEIDLSTYRRLPWENNVPLFLVAFRNPDTGKPLHACPRSLLQETTKKIEAFGGDNGWECMAGAEFEVSCYSSYLPALLMLNLVSWITVLPIQGDRSISR
ncbi:hypothetical protein QFC22_003739 [Naganishia vaughanmartiniae]|uniref:Uncharacterized protein n=1 Tax=Naganishia vaughanmartiniae TaxID=1424756 RepID=A0ACC2X7K5_9TREE|nr:hypothetical protein QFC22_003739 [Naganishia vaughanmartiniae]